MLIKPRQVRRSSKFTSRLKTGSRQRQEYAASTYSMAFIQALLTFGLAVAGVRAYQAVDAQASQVSLMMKLAMPAVFFAGALLVLRACVKNVKAVREMSRSRRRPDE